MPEAKSVLLIRGVIELQRRRVLVHNADHICFDVFPQFHMNSARRAEVLSRNCVRRDQHQRDAKHNQHDGRCARRGGSGWPARSVDGARIARIILRRIRTRPGGAIERIETIRRYRPKCETIHACERDCVTGCVEERHICGWDDHIGRRRTR